MMKKLFFTLTLISALTFSVFAQNSGDNKTEKNPLKTWSVYGHFGSMLFYGDLREYDFYPLGGNADWAVSERQLGYGIGINKTFNSTFTLQGTLLFGKLSGVRRLTGNYFQANMFEYSLNGQINLNNIIFRTGKDRNWYLYGIIGAGLVDFRTVSRKISSESPSDNDVFVSSYGYKEAGTKKDQMTTELVIPVGMGFKYRINNNLSLNIESTIRNVNSDKIDTRVVEGSASDKYGYTSLGITYKFVKDEKDIEWVNPLEAENMTTTQGQQSQQAKGDDGLAKKVDSLTNKIIALDNALIELTKMEEADDDKDGVPNSKDLEPNTKEGALINFQGKTIELTPAAVAPATTTVQTETQPAKETAAKPVVEIVGGQVIGSVFFESGSTSVGVEARERIALVAKMMLTNSEIKLKLEGHTDKVGTQESNDKLSKERAENVKSILVQDFNIAAERIVVEYKGQAEQLSKSFNMINRRVDFIIAK